MAQAYYNKNISATTTPATINVGAEFDIDEILLIANDSLVGNLIVTISGRSAVAGDPYVLQPGEQLKNIVMNVKNIVVSSSSGTVTGRFWGINY